MKRKISVVVGPTASGKSAFGLCLAQKEKGVIINADSMQIYQDLKILSARPSLEEMADVPHFLYGYLNSFEENTVFDWLKKAALVIEQTDNPILVGGTGMYINALINGISPIPPVDLKVREYVRQLPLDEVKKQVINCSAVDSQRLRRALEVQLSTGKPLSFFQELPKQKVLEADFQVYFIHPPREKLYQNCELRFDEMIRSGAIKEVEHLLEIKASNGVLSAIGVPEILSYLKKEISFEEMIYKAKLATRHYAKRQVTWFKHQLTDKIEINNPLEFFK